ncbi:BnaA09g46030D [Brassica napus]|uniref:(rape) hypothetical protein n=1 Tax=Brassica napus TaxID=3708 RepID=A0A078H8E4_BRANA|nr:unnamed protein product [Brassica napus]CDY33797.1 BnaA09g46030D [Brassica napus]
MIRRTCIPLHRKAFALVQPRFSGTGTSIGSSSDRNFSYKEKLRSGLVDIKKDDAVALFQSMIQSRPLPTVVDFSRLFSGIARTKQYDLVLSLCKQMESNGIAHDLYTLSIVINCFCRRRKLGFAFSVFGKMLKLGYEPTTVTFSTLINGLCLEGRVSEAVELVDRIDRMMSTRSIYLWSGFEQNVLCKDESLDDALSLFSEMETKGIKANVFTYTSLIGGFCNAGRWDDGAQLLRDMITRDITPDVVTFNALIDSFVKEGKLTEAQELYNEMITRGIDPNTITYTTLIYGLCMENRLDEANQMMDLMVSKGCDPNSVTYSILINGYCKNKLVDEGMRLFRKMSVRGVVADTVTYSTLIQGFCQTGKPKVAKELFQEMVSIGVPPSVVDGAWDLFCSLPSKGVKPNVKTFTVMISGLCKKGSLPEANILLRKMEEDGIVPNVCTYNTLIRAHLSGGDISNSVELIEEMKRCGFSADASTIKMVMDMLSDGRLDKSFLDMLSGPFGDKSSSSLD